ncbi:adenylate/guanylate cyclase domain-containing protein [Candidatus Peregrinibacteria bacterium]|jgi:adenylate cyclase|nr:adenylate/guanylate cyclase domain-containing protein [Candidatus Peregrinibacteria bacterium]MBT4631423.1 adenylate/guanylate cyclase domain-containing protein [Candidatus Peregrinibacteria bacterium]MBT5516932.1 adenylate/guanylate cyclase domain-containing protein [Candidatus Peregrinibacteria bacterium]MBT5823992.1 adenylate/guanylate cyclase domain-containing protein [Candidatus Peregrinibacteria bacterium]
MLDKKKLLALILIVFFVSFGALFLRGTSVFDVFEKRLSHGLYDERPLNENIIIIGVDERTLMAPSEGGLGPMGAWPRGHMAKVLESIRASGSHSIFLDFVFKGKTETVSLFDIATIFSESENNTDVIAEQLSEYLLEENPQDVAFKSALGEDVFMIKYSATQPILEGNLLHGGDEAGSYEFFTEAAQTAFSEAVTDDNEQAIYSLPIGYKQGDDFEESLALMMGRDFLYRDELSAGTFIENDKYYLFDESRKIPVDNGQMLVNYAGDSYSFPSVSFVDVFKGNIEDDAFDGKIVLIGATAPILQDRHFTPIDQNVPMPGVEIQANAIQTVLDGQFLSKQGQTGFSIFVVCFLLISTFAFLYLPVLFGTGVLILELFIFPFYVDRLFSSGVILDIIWPIAALLSVYFLSMVYRNFTEFREKRKIKSAFSHYVSAELVQQISEDPSSLVLGGEKRNITVMFIDFENFTNLTEKLVAAELVQLVNTYFDALANVIMRHGGTVDKFEGDAIMALFGAPIASETHAKDSCETALEIRSKMEEINKTTGVDLKVRLGIASGEAIVGNMGSAERFDYTAMGDTVNIAARLESGNKFYGTRVLMNSENMKACEDTMNFRRIDRVRLKGKAEAIDIYQLLGRKGSESDAGRAVIEEWHQALEYYRNQDWAEAVQRMKKVLEKLPEDGPASAYLKRIEELKTQHIEGWDGTWNFDKK